MADHSKIQWTEASWNPWHGCIKVSAGCKYCYMYRDKEKYGQDPTTAQRSKTKFNDPLKWKEPKIIFTCSWSDWFIDLADEWRDEAWAIIKATPQHTYQILTKRPERILGHLPDDWGNGYTNVWIGVSVENQAAANERIPLLLEVPAAVRFLSCEPLLSNVKISDWFYPRELIGMTVSNLDETKYSSLEQEIHWVIVGGESGNEIGKYRYRPSELQWYYDIINQCIEAGVPVFVKQLGTHLSKQLGLKDRHGGNIDEFPAGLQIRQFPKTQNQFNNETK